jgi:Nif-specific regulatory protein
VPHLTILSGPMRGQNVPITQPAFRIGRDPTLELPISDSRASRVHLEISGKNNQYILKDLKSKNGTLVNGAPASSRALMEGDQIQIGETRFAFSTQDAPAQPAEDGKGRTMDSVVAARMPVGVAPALGTAGTTGGAERFETMELSAPLAILRGSETNVELDNRITPIDAGNTRAVKSLRALYAIAKAAAESKTVAELWRALSSGLLSALEADRVTPVTIEGKSRWRIAEPAGDETAVKAAFSKVPVSRTIVDYALRTRRSVLTAPRNDERFGHSKSVGEQGISSALCVPIVAHDQTLGLIYADRLGGESFTREDQELLTAACLLAGPALAGLKRLEDALNKKERLIEELKNQYNMLGTSVKMRETAQFIERAAPSNSVVLILGESGTGKELVARAIHYKSTRNDAPFVVVNCAALSESLIESELFGHVKGSFTGATADRAGRFEMAHEGTIFLDEIGELTNTCQTKLLRVLEQGEISRVGEGRVRKVDVRVLAATNRDLQAEVKAGRFREDLFYRLNVLSLCLPPLHERGGDVQILIEHYLSTAAARSGRQRMEFSEEATQALMHYRWPGNVRELRNLCERMAVLCPHEVVGIADLPAECRAAAIKPPDSVMVATPIESSEIPKPTDSVMIAMPVESGELAKPVDALLAPTPAAEFRYQPEAPDSEKLADIEKVHILKMLKAADNNKKLTAEKLGIDRSTLYAKLRAYGIMS